MPLLLLSVVLLLFLDSTSRLTEESFSGGDEGEDIEATMAVLVLVLVLTFPDETSSSSFSRTTSFPLFFSSSSSSSLEGRFLSLSLMDDLLLG